MFTLRFVQKFKPEHKEIFMALEKEFIALEKQGLLPQGKRQTPFSGTLPSNTLIWECSFPDLTTLHNNLKAIQENDAHERLYQKQAPYIVEAYTEIYELMN